MPGRGERSIDEVIRKLHLPKRYPAIATVRFDPSSSRPADEEEAAVVDRARDSGDVVILDAGPVKGTDRSSPVVRFYTPVYESSAAPVDSQARLDQFRGCVIADLRLDALLAGVFGTEPDARVSLALFNAPPSPATRVYATPSFDLPSARFSDARPFERGGKAWTLEVRSAPGLDLISSRGLVPQIFAAGLLLSGLLAALTWVEARSRRRAQQLLATEREALAEAERMSRQKDEFLATLSHELRTPINAIIGWTHMLREMRLPDQTREKALDTVQRNAQIQAQLIDDLLDMSRIVAGKGRLDMRRLELTQVIDAALNVVRPSASDRNLLLHTTVPPNLPRVNGDAERLQQVLCNLLTNAIKFTPEGGRIEVEARSVQGTVQLAVKDSGVGIDHEFLPYVFERFRQADASTTRAHGGLGLGLSIAKSLIELHGGTIRADSDGPQRGATFTITLPAQ
jgi:signal transduction histidine kinase